MRHLTKDTYPWCALARVWHATFSTMQAAFLCSIWRATGQNPGIRTLPVEISGVDDFLALVKRFLAFEYFHTTIWLKGLLHHFADSRIPGSRKRTRHPVCSLQILSPVTFPQFWSILKGLKLKVRSEIVGPMIWIFSYTSASTLSLICAPAIRLPTRGRSWSFTWRSRVDWKRLFSSTSHRKILPEYFLTCQLHSPFFFTHF